MSGAAAPCVVMGHGFTGTQDQLAVLTSDNRRFGPSGGASRHVVDAGEQDPETDPRRAARIARAAPRGEVVRYPVGHLAVHEDAVRSRVLENQGRFLVRHLRPGAEPAGGR